MNNKEKKAVTIVIKLGINVLKLFQHCKAQVSSTALATEEH